jgi:hypothetical protein
MTAPVDVDAPPEPLAVAGLRAVRQARKTTPRRKTATTRRAPTSSRADAAAKRGKYVDRIVGAIKTGCAVLSVRAPIQAGIIMERAEPLAEALQRVADEDKRVDAFLSKVSGWFGKSTAWGELGGQVATAGAAVALSVGAVPVGPVGMALAFLGGELLDAGVRRAAVDAAKADLKRAGIVAGDQGYDQTLRDATTHYYQQYSLMVPVPGEAPPVDGDDQGATGQHDQGDPPTEPLPGWYDS